MGAVERLQKLHQRIQELHQLNRKGRITEQRYWQQWRLLEQAMTRIYDAYYLEISFRGARWSVRPSPVGWQRKRLARRSLRVFLGAREHVLR